MEINCPKKLPTPVDWWSLTQTSDRYLSDSDIKIKNLLIKSNSIQPFDWMHWSTLDDYFADKSIINSLPEEDVLKLVIGFRRADRFFEGTMESAIKDGTMLHLANRIEELKQL